MTTSIFLADLTHRGLLLSSNVFPLSIGLVGAYLQANRPDISLQLFKYPEDFSAAFEAAPPRIVGFANYSWNCELSYGFVRAIKSRWPDTVVVFGGPNYGLEIEEMKRFWARYPLVDFYIIKEGEAAFASLVSTLIDADFDVAVIKERRDTLPNCHYMVGDDLVTGAMLPRLNIDDIPSPYLKGLMSKFFDAYLVPMIHTTRGCPFSCAFCTEGNPYYNVVSQRLSTLRDELHCIAVQVQGPRDLFVSDANFGMYKQDFEKAEIIAECQKTYQYPINVFVSTGKNQKQRVIEVSQMLNGAINLAASLQSTDETVLANVSRSNISIDKLAEIGLKANKANTGTYCEIILGLPGDSFAAHRQSLRDAVTANFDNIRMYQLIMLPQTRINTPDMREKFGVQTRHRIMPRSFGRYTLAGDDFVAVESEEILIEHNTMPFSDYKRCREFDLTIEILHNGRVFEEIRSICKFLGYDWFSFIEAFFERRRQHSASVASLYEEFTDIGTTHLWGSREDLEANFMANVDTFLSDSRGTNEISAGKAIAFFRLFPEINSILFRMLREWLMDNAVDDITLKFVRELEMISYLRKHDLFNLKFNQRTKFGFNMARLQEAGFSLPPDSVVLDAPRTFQIAHHPRQREQLAAHLREFGHSLNGLGKMLMRFPHLYRVFRTVDLVS